MGSRGRERALRPRHRSGGDAGVRGARVPRARGVPRDGRDDGDASPRGSEVEARGSGRSHDPRRHDFRRADRPRARRARLSRRRDDGARGRDSVRGRRRPRRRDGRSDVGDLFVHDRADGARSVEGQSSRRARRSVSGKGPSHLDGSGNVRPAGPADRCDPSRRGALSREASAGRGAAAPLRRGEQRPSADHGGGVGCAARGGDRSDRGGRGAHRKPEGDDPRFSEADPARCGGSPDRCDGERGDRSGARRLDLLARDSAHRGNGPGARARDLGKSDRADRADAASRSRTVASSSSRSVSGRRDRNSRSRVAWE